MSKDNIMKKKKVDVVRCPICDTTYGISILGVYTCRRCGHQEADTFGKVRAYLLDHKRASAHEIAEATGVSLKAIDEFLREGRIEITEGSQGYIKCQKCGIDIRYGRFCPECGLTMCKQISSALNSNHIGEVPKATKEKMRFLGERIK